MLIANYIPYMSLNQDLELGLSDTSMNSGMRGGVSDYCNFFEFLYYCFMVGWYTSSSILHVNIGASSSSQG